MNGTPLFAEATAMTLRMLGIAAAAAALAAGTQAAADDHDSAKSSSSSTRTSDGSGQSNTTNGAADPQQPAPKAAANPGTDNNASHAGLPGSQPSDPTTAGASLTGTAGGAHVQSTGTPVPLRQR
jgi:hypothetical protein